MSVAMVGMMLVLAGTVVLAWERVERWPLRERRARLGSEASRALAERLRGAVWDFEDRAPRVFLVLVAAGLGLAWAGWLAVPRDWGSFRTAEWGGILLAIGGTAAVLDGAAVYRSWWASRLRWRGTFALVTDTRREAVPLVVNRFVLEFLRLIGSVAAAKPALEIRGIGLRMEEGRARDWHCWLAGRLAEALRPVVQQPGDARTAVVFLLNASRLAYALRNSLPGGPDRDRVDAFIAGFPGRAEAWGQAYEGRPWLARLACEGDSFNPLLHVPVSPLTGPGDAVVAAVHGIHVETPARNNPYRAPVQARAPGGAA